MSTLHTLFCPDCLVEQAFEAPVCEDGHGADCPELCCLECSTAVLVGGLVDLIDEELPALAQVIHLPIRHAA